MSFVAGAWATTGAWRTGDGEAGTFKIDIMAAVFGSCKCGKLKADYIGPDLKCPPC